MVKEMLSVFMDGITDANMLIDYWERAEVPEQKAWFSVHAKQRVEQLMNDFTFIKNQLELEMKVKEGDAIAEALHSHLNHQVMELRRKMNM